MMKVNWPPVASSSLLMCPRLHFALSAAAAAATSASAPRVRDLQLNSKFYFKFFVRYAWRKHTSNENITRNDKTVQKVNKKRDKTDKNV